MHCSNNNNQPEENDEVSSINELWWKIRKMLVYSSSAIESKVQDLATRIKDMEDQLNSFKSDPKITTLKEAVDDVRDQLSTFADSVDRMARSQELVIFGVPFATDEDLGMLFRNICVTLGYAPSQCPLVHCKRLLKRRPETGACPPILCQFAMNGSRNEFYKRYFKKRTLCQRDVGFEDDNRIYINENLTQETRQIYSNAVKLRKSGVLQKVRVQNGVVVIHPTSSDATREPIYSLRQLYRTVNKPFPTSYSSPSNNFLDSSPKFSFDSVRS